MERSSFRVRFGHSISNASLITSVTFARRISIEGRIHLMADKLPSMHPVTLRTMFVSHLESNIGIGCENEILIGGYLAISVILQFYNFCAFLF